MYCLYTANTDVALSVFLVFSNHIYVLVSTASVHTFITLCQPIIFFCAGYSQPISLYHEILFQIQMISVERVLQYTHLPIEANLESKPDHKPPDTWPSSGSLQARDVSLKYSPSAPFVLKNINFDINGSEKVRRSIRKRVGVLLVMK